MLVKEEIEYFRKIKFADILHATTNITPSDVQDNLLFWVEGDPCPQPEQLNATTLDPCPFLKGYDYFQVGTQALLSLLSSLLFKSLWQPPN